MLAFMAAFSQEQMSVLAVVWIALFIFSVGWEQKTKSERIHMPTYLVLAGISALVGGIITIAAPGNFVRADTCEEFYNKNFLIRSIENAGKIVNCNIGYWNWIFVLIMTVVFGTAAAIYFRKKKIVALMFVFAGYYILERFFLGECSRLCSCLEWRFALCGHCVSLAFFSYIIISGKIIFFYLY